MQGHQEGGLPAQMQTFTNPTINYCFAPLVVSKATVPANAKGSYKRCSFGQSQNVGHLHLLSLELGIAMDKIWSLMR